MFYQDFQGLQLSALGFGTMRLPQNGAAQTDVDEEQVAAMVAYALEQGINYFDTAYAYHEGASERVLGKVLSQHSRESFYLADKFPSYSTAYFGREREIFQEQLDRCQVEYFDFYLCHNINEGNIDFYLDTDSYDTIDYLLEEKAAGRIRHLGFSVHGSYDTMKRFLDAYGQYMEFGQVQLNWLDWDFQEAKRKVELLDSLGIPVWVMEPLRGGSLVTLEPADQARLEALRPSESPLEWAFHFLESIPSVKVILSGMSNLEQMQQNVAIFAEPKPTTAAENEVLFELGKEMTSRVGLPCTACHYCTSHCPVELDIPWIIGLYNEHTFSKGGFLAPMAFGNVEEDKRPGACISCQSCVAVCPQQIDIPAMMKDFVQQLSAVPAGPK